MSTANHRVFELVDPTDSDLPRFVTWGNSGWLDRRWALRHVDGSLLAEWFRELEGRGLYPGVSTRWVPAEPVRGKLAARLARARHRTVVEWAGGWPPWLLGDRFYGHPLGCELPVKYLPAGRVYRSIIAGARGEQVSAGLVKYSLRTGLPDGKGGLWVEAGLHAAVGN